MKNTLHRLYILSTITNCHTNILCVLLAVDLKQAVIQVIVVMLSDNFTREISFSPEH